MWCHKYQMSQTFLLVFWYFCVIWWCVDCVYPGVTQYTSPFHKMDGSLISDNIRWHVFTWPHLVVFCHVSDTKCALIKNKLWFQDKEHLVDCHKSGGSVCSGCSAICLSPCTPPCQITVASFSLSLPICLLVRLFLYATAGCLSARVFLDIYTGCIIAPCLLFCCPQLLDIKWNQDTIVHFTASSSQWSYCLGAYVAKVFGFWVTSALWRPWSISRLQQQQQKARVNENEPRRPWHHSKKKYFLGNSLPVYISQKSMT